MIKEFQGNPTVPPNKKTLSKNNPKFWKPLKKTKSNFSFLSFARNKKKSNKSKDDESSSTRSKSQKISNTTTSFIGNMTRLGAAVVSKTKSFVSLRGLPKGQTADFIQPSNLANEWKADENCIFKCTNEEQDNVPSQFTWNGYHFCVSQNRLAGRKPEGQDCMGVASHKDWEVLVLCDGHDRDGHLISQAICKSLPNIILKKVEDKAESSSMLGDELIKDAFREAEEHVSWSTTQEYEQGDYAKMLKGEFKGHVGYVAQIHEEEEQEEEEAENEVEGEEEPEPDLTVTIVINNEEIGYQRFEAKESEIATPRYKGGSTCVALIRNTSSNKCKVAVLGDSRLMVMGDIGSKFLDDDFVDPVLLTTYIDTEQEEQQLPNGFFTPQHNVYNAAERERLQAYQAKMKGEYVVNLEEGYLVNPETKMQIQPTRGFGDVEMQKAGFIHEPEVSSEFVLSPNSVLLAGSDGIFDGDLWEDDECLLKFVYEKHRVEKQDNVALLKSLYEETLKRCDDVSALDDISMFAFVTPQGKEEKKEEIVKPFVMDMKALKKGKDRKSRVMKSRRSTIQRPEHSKANLFKRFFTVRRPAIEKNT